MRDYAVHYSFPLHTYIRSLVNPSGLFANKSTLLNFKKWKHAKADIEKMPEKIKIEPHIIQMQKCIKELFEYCLLMFSSRLVDVIQYANDLIKSAKENRPIFISFESEEKYRAGEFTMHPVEFGTVQSALRDLRNHPGIVIKDRSQKKMETRIEFYYNDELIMEGSISYFKEIMTNPTNPNDEDPSLSLGDRFTLDEFPEKGISTVVRVMKMTTLANQSNGNPDTIQYYLEHYDE